MVSPGSVFVHMSNTRGNHKCCIVMCVLWCFDVIKCIMLFCFLFLLFIVMLWLRISSVSIVRLCCTFSSLRLLDAISYNTNVGFWQPQKWTKECPNTLYGLNIIIYTCKWTNVYLSDGEIFSHCNSIIQYYYIQNGR